MKHAIINLTRLIKRLWGWWGEGGGGGGRKSYFGSYVL